MGIMQALCSRGDTKTTWNPDNEDETAAAKATYETLKKKGYQAFRTTSSGEKSTRLESFDPKAGVILMVPQLKGG